MDEIVAADDPLLVTLTEMFLLWPTRTLPNQRLSGLQLKETPAAKSAVEDAMVIPR
jgi:hypothetical protein